MFNKLLQPWLIKVNHRCTLDEVKHSQQKEKRIIDTLEPVLNQHRLVIDRRLIEKDLALIEKEQTRPYSLLHQLTRVTREKGALRHDDRLDALAGGVAYWVESMARDHEDAHESWHDQEQERGIEEFLSYIDHMNQPKSNRGNPFGSSSGVQGGWLGSYGAH